MGAQALDRKITGLPHRNVFSFSPHIGSNVSVYFVNVFFMCSGNDQSCAIGFSASVGLGARLLLR